MNQFAGYGWKIAKDSKGKAHKVIDEGECRVMAQVKIWKEAGYTMDEIVELARDKNFKNPRTGKCYPYRTLRRVYDYTLTNGIPSATQRQGDAVSLQEPVLASS